LSKDSIEIYDLQGKPVKSTELPAVFETPIRRDLIKRAVISAQSKRYQPQGRDPWAGQRTTAESVGVGRGLARVPRVKGRGSPASGKGALAAMTVGGRRAHPPKSEKNIVKSLNKKERRLAISSAVAATADEETVRARGHRTEEVSKFPLVVVDEIQSIQRSSEVREVFEALGIWEDVERVKRGIKIRAGKGKFRGRRLKIGKGPLIVVGQDRGIVRAARNIPGVDVVLVNNLNAELLAPGIHPGRLTVWSESGLRGLTRLRR